MILNSRRGKYASAKCCRDACWLLRGIGPPLPIVASPFSGRWAFLFQEMGTFYRGMGTSLPMVSPLAKDCKPFTEGWEPRLRRMGTPLPNDGNLFYGGIVTVFAVGREPLSPWMRTSFSAGWAHFSKRGENLSERWELRFRGMGKPFSEDRAHIFRGT